MLNREELEQIPLRYRWLLKLFLKLPNPSFPYLILKRLPEIEGIFWAFIVPIFVMLYFLFGVWLVSFLSLVVSFPFNVLLGLFIPTAIFILFLRIQLERTIQWWKNLRSGSREWQVSDVAEELIELLRKQQKREGNVA